MFSRHFWADGSDALYQRLNASHPLPMSMGLGCVIAGLGDAVCQYQEGASALDLRRVGELSVVRSFVYAPLLFIYFPWLHNNFRSCM